MKSRLAFHRPRVSHGGVRRPADFEDTDGRLREADCVPEVVDPSPVIEEKLTALAAEHEPRIMAMERRLAEVHPDDARRLKTDLRQAKRTYAAARQTFERLRGPGIAS
jgi:hypothetical protein